MNPLEALRSLFIDKPHQPLGFLGRSLAVGLEDGRDLRWMQASERFVIGYAKHLHGSRIAFQESMAFHHPDCVG